MGKKHNFINTPEIFEKCLNFSFYFSSILFAGIVNFARTCISAVYIGLNKFPAALQVTLRT